MKGIEVIGAGLAGCEAAWQAARLGVPVTLREMKPARYTPAHRYPGFAELVCSNSFRSNQVTNAIGLLKAELSRLDSLILEAAYGTEVPAGSALAVDRRQFSDYVTGKIEQNPLIRIEEGEVTSLPEDPDAIVVVATGPLTSDALSEAVARETGAAYLHFFDAAAPIVDASTVDREIVFEGSRYGKGEAAYLNCPMNREEYETFFRELLRAPVAPLHAFDKNEAELAEEAGEDFTVFEGCMPVEVMARRGEDTLRFGPLKPVGLIDPRTGREPYAVVQLRQENTAKTMYNLVGFQTHLTWQAQRDVFRLIPGLSNAEFLRYGVMHRNTYLDSPRLLSFDYSLRNRPNLFFAGQMTGVEGYIESAASGFVAGVNAARRARGEEPYRFPPETVIGSMAAYVSDERVGAFSPMNANFGLIAPLSGRVRGGKKGRCEAFAERALARADDVREDLFSK